MIEYRAILRRDLAFEGGFKLEQGTFVYVVESKEGWLGSYYTPKGSCHSFALDEDAFSILRSADIHAEQLVVMPDEPPLLEKVKEANELTRRRLEARIKSHKTEAKALSKLLRDQFGVES